MDLDLIIVGAGPAGISAAIEARARGLSVLVLDENPGPGGRIWQALETRGAHDQDDVDALRILQAFRTCGASAHWRATVWAIESDGTVFWSTDRAAHSARSQRVLLATGTTERPMPIPGWTLPGVMTVGGAQIALKTAGLLPGGTTWIAGQGPLLLLYTVQALRAGGRIAGVLDLSDGTAPLRALRYLPPVLGVAGDLRKGLAWRREIARAGV
jgi:NADPH-dependent 2,4-dienoyl-CoA reductase/sulfur reductase-like enzyme